MPRTYASPSKEFENLTVRFNAEVGAWLRAEAQRTGRNGNDLLRSFIDDFRNCFSIPEQLAEVLKAEMQETKKDLRAYVIGLLTCRAIELLRAQPQPTPTKKK